jgi:hypothetical protein
VVVNDIYDDSDTMLVGRFNKLLKGIRSAVNTFNGKGMSRIVTPRKIAGNSMIGITSTALIPSSLR